MISILYKGRDTDNEGEIMMVNHRRKTAESMLYGELEEEWIEEEVKKVRKGLGVEKRVVLGEIGMKKYKFLGISSFTE